MKQCQRSSLTFSGLDAQQQTVSRAGAYMVQPSKSNPIEILSSSSKLRAGIPGPLERLCPLRLQNLSSFAQGSDLPLQLFACFSDKTVVLRQFQPGPLMPETLSGEKATGRELPMVREAGCQAQHTHHPSNRSGDDHANSF